MPRSQGASPNAHQILSRSVEIWQYEGQKPVFENFFIDSVIIIQAIMLLRYRLLFNDDYLVTLSGIITLSVVKRNSGCD